MGSDHVRELSIVRKILPFVGVDLVVTAGRSRLAKEFLSNGTKLSPSRSSRLAREHSH